MKQLYMAAGLLLVATGASAATHRTKQQACHVQLFHVSLLIMVI